MKCKITLGDVMEIKQDKPSIGQIHLVTAIQAEPD